jgi:hypothetical protein
MLSKHTHGTPSFSIIRCATVVFPLALPPHPPVPTRKGARGHVVRKRERARRMDREGEEKSYL